MYNIIYIIDIYIYIHIYMDNTYNNNKNHNTYILAICLYRL